MNRPDRAPTAPAPCAAGLPAAHGAGGGTSSRTATVEWAGVRLGLNAGTDIPMAHAIGREIIHAGLADHAFIERATSRFEEYEQLVEPWTPSLAEKVTGVPAAAIRELAHAYARAEHARLCWTPGATGHHNGTDDVRAVMNLSLLTGHAGRGGDPHHGPNATETSEFGLVRHDPPLDLTDEKYPIRLTTGQRLDSHNTGAQNGGHASPARRRASVELCPEDAEHCGVVVGEEVRIFSRRGSMVAPVWVDTALPPGLAFTTLHFPGEVDAGRTATGAHCPIAGTTEFDAAAIRIEKLPVATVVRG